MHQRHQSLPPPPRSAALKINELYQYRSINQLNQLTKISGSKRLLYMLFACARANKNPDQRWKFSAQKFKITDVTMTAPLASTHNKITWEGVIPRRLAAFSTTASTGPPGDVVIDLKNIYVYSSISLNK